MQSSPHRSTRQKTSSGSGGGSNPGIALTGDINHEWSNVTMSLSILDPQACGASMQNCYMTAFLIMQRADLVVANDNLVEPPTLI